MTEQEFNNWIWWQRYSASPAISVGYYFKIQHEERTKIFVSEFTESPFERAKKESKKIGYK